MKSVISKIDRMNELIEAFQKDHREDRRKLDARMQKLENYVHIQKIRKKEVISNDIE